MQDYIKLESRRWYIISLFSLYTFSNATAFVTFAPIIEQSKSYYQATESQILWFSNVWYIVYIALSVPTIFMFDKRLDLSLILGTFLNGLGAWIRYLAASSFALALFGQIIIAISQLFILPAPVYITERWFGQNERAKATAIMIFANTLGVSTGFLTSLYFVKNGESLHNYLFYMAIFMSLSFLPSMFVFKNKPEFPANLTSQNAQKVDIVQCIKNIFTKGKYIMITLSLSLYLGVLWTILSIIGIILKDYSQENLGYIGICISVCGTFSGIIATMYIDNASAKKQMPPYDFYVNLFSTISLLSLIVFAIFVQLNLQNQYQWVTFIIFCFVGVGFQSFIPVASQSFLESLYPMQEVAIFTVFNQFANVIGLIGNLLSTVQAVGQYGAWMLVALVLPLYIYTVFFYKTGNQRFLFENNFNDLELEDKQSTTSNIITQNILAKQISEKI